MRRTIISVAIAVLSAVAPGAAPKPQEIDAAISELGSSDPAAREKATKFLWSAGKAAESALKDARENGPPEVAARARQILRDFELGVRPEMPAHLADLVRQYESGDANNKQQVIEALMQQRGESVNVLLRLRERETDPQIREQIMAAILDSGAVVPRLIADGEIETVKDLLRSAALGGREAAGADLAALLLESGGLNEEIARLGEAGDDNVAMLRAHLLHASGDTSAAADALAKASPAAQPLRIALLARAGRWKELLQAAAQNQSIDDQVTRAAQMAAYARLANAPATFENSITQLKGFVAAEPDIAWQCAESLFLNDRLDDGMAMLVGHNDYQAAILCAIQRYDIDGAMKLLQSARKANNAATAVALPRVANMKRFLGEKQAARDLLKEAAQVAARLGNRAAYEVIVEVAWDLDDPALTEQYALDALKLAEPNGPTEGLLDKVGIQPSDDAGRFWRFLRSKRPEESFKDTLSRLRALMNNELEPRDLLALAQAADSYATRLEPALREAMIISIGARLAAAKQYDEAARYFSKALGISSSPEALMRLGDLQSEQKHWKEAVDLYKRAFERAPSRPDALYLCGWAKVQAGSKDDGEKLIETARLLPLGDVDARQSFAVFLARRGFADESRRQRELIPRITPMLSIPTSDSIRESAARSAQDKKYFQAAEQMEIANLDVLETNTYFMDMRVALGVRGFIHKNRSLGYLQEGRVDLAMREAEFFSQYLPGDSDSIIDLVRQLQASGHGKQSDELYGKFRGKLGELLEKYPASGPLHNGIAWLAARCGRDLEDALRHATRAVELEPKSTACIDTLAEVHFQRGEIEPAIAAMKRCVELEPKVERHRKQIERFKAAQTQPATSPALTEPPPA